MASILYERYTINDDVARPIYGIRWAAQSFTIGNTGPNEDHHITSVKLKIYRSGSPGGTMTIGIRTVDGEGKPSGDDLCSVDYPAGDLPETPTWLEFTFVPTALLSASTQYTIVVRAPGGSSTNQVRWRMGSYATYGGGTTAWSLDDGNTWVLSPYRNDTMFEEYGTAPPPEICSWIENKGGPTGLTIPDVFELVDSYLFETPPTGYTFIPTLQNVFGVIDYYLGFDGDAATGCDFYP